MYYPLKKALAQPRTYARWVTSLLVSEQNFLNFSSMWKSLKKGDYTMAGYHALDSVWATQTAERAQRHARVLEGEGLTKIYKGLL